MTVIDVLLAYTLFELCYWLYSFAESYDDVMHKIRMLDDDSDVIFK